MYAVQTVLHSVIASVLADCALLAWNLKTPAVKQRFRFLALFLPVALFPIYQAIFPRRGDVYFRLESLVDANKWFFLDIWGGIPLLALFVAILILTAAIFFVQEFVPIVFQMLRQARGDEETTEQRQDEPIERKMLEAIEGLPFSEDSVEILNDEDLILFSSTGFQPKIYVSTGLIESFSAEHLKAAFAHEIGHIRRSRKPLLLTAYILRMLMFYNPIAMIEFRKLAQEEEKVCDDIAVGLTGKPGALAEAIDMLRPAEESTKIRGIEGVASGIEHYSHELLLKSRIHRIGERDNDDLNWAMPYFVTVFFIIGVSYFIV